MKAVSIGQACDSFREQCVLTPAESDILWQIIGGYSNADIARSRRRASGTVAKQVRAIFRKFGVATRRELSARLSRALGDGTPANLAVHVTEASCFGDRERLSEREREVLLRVAYGQSNKCIAYDLGLSPSTVGVLLFRARAKCGATVVPRQQAEVDIICA